MKNQLKKGQKTAQKAVLLIIILTAIKAVTAFIANSTVLLSDAVHSASDLLPVLASWFGLKTSQKKADKKFAYGYYKAESLSTLLVAVMIVIAGLTMLIQGFNRVLITSVISMPFLALIVALADAIIMYVFGCYQEKIGQEINSSSLRALARENKTHVFSSLAVFSGILMSFYNIPYGEGLITIGISFLIILIGFKAGKEALFSLMDVSPDQEIEDKIIEAIKSVAGIEDFFDLRLRQAGPFIFGEVKVGIRKHIDVTRAHQIADGVEKEIKGQVKQVDSFIVHVEPFKTDYRQIVIPLAEKKGLESQVFPKFARAPYFLFVNLKKKNLVGYYILKNPFKYKKTKAGFVVAKLITKQKSDILITNQIGEIAFYTLRDQLFDIYYASSKTAKQSINQFNKGRLKQLNKATKEVK